MELVRLAILLIRLLIFLIKLLFRGLRAVLAWVQKQQKGPLARSSETVSQPSVPSPPAARSIDAVLRPFIDELEGLGRESSERAERCRTEPANLRFIASFEHVSKRAAHLAKRLRAHDIDVIRQANGIHRQLDALFEVTSFMAAQRRDRDLVDLLGDADALAEACYRPIVDHCRKRQIQLSSDRAVTVVDGDKLYFFSIDDPTGLATVVLPGAFTSELGWWPALAHEIGHDFYRSVAGLPEELVTSLGLPTDPRLPTGAAPLTAADLDRALFAWHEELFADAFGTMMLGPAYVRTMMWTFGEEGSREAVRAAAMQEGSFEEHPPSHVRVAAACRLLGRMGYGAEGDRLEIEWRKRIGPVARIEIPSLREVVFACKDDLVIELAARVGTLLYQQGMRSLAEQPLRSIFGLDFGPREHAQAGRVARSLAAGQRPSVRDPRLLIAGGVLARFERPDQALRTYRLVRQAIIGVAEAPVSSSDATEDVASSFERDGEKALSPSLVRDALVLGALLESPLTTRRFRFPQAR